MSFIVAGYGRWQVGKALFTIFRPDTMDVSSSNCRIWSRSAFILGVFFYRLCDIWSPFDLTLKGGLKEGCDSDRVHTSRWPCFDRPFENKSSFDPPTKIKCERSEPNPSRQFCHCVLLMVWKLCTHSPWHKLWCLLHQCSQPPTHWCRKSSL